jgi:hypothetical protein
MLICAPTAVIVLIHVPSRPLAPAKDQPDKRHTKKGGLRPPFFIADRPPASGSSPASITGHAGKKFGSGEFAHLFKSGVTRRAWDEQILFTLGYHLRVLQFAGRAIQFVYCIGVHGPVSCTFFPI